MLNTVSGIEAIIHSIEAPYEAYNPTTLTEIEVIPPTKVAKITESVAFGKYDLVKNRESVCPRNILAIPLTATNVSTFNTFAITLPTTAINFCKIPK